MEYGKKDWQRSEGQYRSLGREERDKEKCLSAYHPADREKTKEKQPNEMMRLESSYGGITFGANRERKMTLVVHEKKRAAGPGLKKDNREVEGAATASFSQLRGDVRTNSHDRLDSALMYQESLEKTPLWMMTHLQEMMDELSIKSGEKILPFLDRKADRAKHKEIQKMLRESQEKGDCAGYRMWSARQEDFQREQTEKEQLRLKFYRELTFAGKKAGELMKEDGAMRNLFFEAMAEMETEEGAEDESENGTESDVPEELT